MEMILKLKEDSVTLILRHNKANVDETSFELGHNLTEALLPAVDRLLSRNKLDLKKDIKEFRLVSHLKKSYTSDRIARSVVNALNWAKDY